MKDFKWKVVPICDRQLRDVNPEDILNDGLYRKCNIYKGGGGYDKFSDIYRYRNESNDNRNYNNQFVVQLYGCTLNCPYCYVTHDGVYGEYISVDTQKLLSDFYKSKLDVFHLMGGAPAIYMEHWYEILDELKDIYPFHSDFLCVEKEYDVNVLKELAKYKNSLYAVSIKGSTKKEFQRNTGRELDENLFWSNLEKLWEYKVPAYLTFTGMDTDSIKHFREKLESKFPTNYGKILENSFAINLVKYKALG